MRDVKQHWLRLKWSKVLLLTISLDNLNLMACNPSIGGPAKANLVREIDALGEKWVKM